MHIPYTWPTFGVSISVLLVAGKSLRTRTVLTCFWLLDTLIIATTLSPVFIRAWDEHNVNCLWCCDSYNSILSSLGSWPLAGSSFWLLRWPGLWWVAAMVLMAMLSEEWWWVWALFCSTAQFVLSLTKVISITTFSTKVWDMAWSAPVWGLQVS